MAAQMNSIKDPFITLSSGALMQCKTVFQLLPWEMFTYQQKIHNTKKKNLSLISLSHLKTLSVFIKHHGYQN